MLVDVAKLIVYYVIHLGIINMTIKLIQTFFKSNITVWEYGICNGVKARRHKINKNVQFIIWKKGDQKYVDGIGHTEDKWINFDSSWWNDFTLLN